MWWLSSTTLHVGLGAQVLAWATKPGLQSTRIASCGKENFAPQDPSSDAVEPWRAVVGALAQFLTSKRAEKSTPLRIVLPGQWAHWQLLPWRAEITRPQELAAYAALRFRETYGTAAQDWTVLHTVQPPGMAMPSCAVDGGLMDALRSTCAAANTSLVGVTPYFASAFDHWRKEFKGNSAWFCLIEPDCLSLGLLRDKQWLALHSQRLDGDWREALPAMMAHMGIAAGLGDAVVPLYLGGTVEQPAPVAGLPFVWLHPRFRTPPQAAGWRMALGV